ncbi:MAG: tetratricopeptide repeat protein, partial [Armatimonadota bacterium]|nr:tetratricopeptide repeat protein [Armatimonadota bacterium]
ALHLRHDFRLAHTNLGQVLASLKDWDGAINEFQQAVRLEPANADAHSLLGWALHCQARDDHSFGYEDEAIRHYQEALRLDPKTRITRRNISDIYFHRGQWGHAFAHWLRSFF